MSDTLPDVWTLTPVDGNTREFYDAMFVLHGSTRCVRPHERRGGVRGVFDLIVEGLDGLQRQEMMERIVRAGLRRITEEERYIISVDVLLPGQREGGQ